MRNTFLILLLVSVIAVAFYLLGRKSGSSQVKTDIVQNVGVVKQIAELAALDVSGTTSLKVTNNTGQGNWDKFKNYFTESTLLLSLPFDARYGVDLTNQQMNIDTKSGTVIIYLPECKLLNMQFRLDKTEAMTQSGIFSSVTVNEYVQAQKQLYNQAVTSLEKNSGYIKLAEENISLVLSRYYEPLGYKVKCVFGKGKSALP